MAEVKWIKLNVGMFDGNSFKKIKKAKIGGESFRDKLTAIWFELMDLAGKCNAGGMLIESQEIPFANIEDIAILIDREPEELELCMQFYISNRMVTVIDDVYMLSNWSKYQNEDGLEKIREQNRIRQKRWYENHKALPNVIPNVSLMDSNATDIDIEEEKEEEKEVYKEIVEYLNQKAGTHYKHSTKSTQTKIDARLKEGYTIENFKTVIDKKSKEWKGSQMEQYLRPETLFGTKFESYLNANIVQEEKKPKTSNKFNNFEGRQYSSDKMADMERLLLRKSLNV